MASGMGEGPFQYPLVDAITGGLLSDNGGGRYEKGKWNEGGTGWG